MLHPGSAGRGSADRSGPGRRKRALAAKISATHICVVQALQAARETGPTPWVDHRMSLNQGGHAMRTFDLAPLYRSTVGFDRLFSLLDQVAGVDGAPSYPPYNIERTGENAYRITLAVAGFTEADLSIEKKEDTLTIRGEKQVKDEKAGEVLYQGIAAR